LRDPSLKVKAEAVRAIVKLGEQATGPVIRLLNDAIDERDNMTARYAAKILGLIGDRSISSVLVKLLKSEDKFVACERRGARATERVEGGAGFNWVAGQRAGAGTKCL